jgi:hypothetical protein
MTFLISKLLESNTELKIFFVGVKVLYCKSKYRNEDASKSKTKYANLGVLPGEILAILTTQLKAGLYYICRLFLELDLHL